MNRPRCLITITLSLLVLSGYLLPLEPVRAESAARVINQSSMIIGGINQTGHLYMMGEVQNTGTTWLQSVNVSATVTDEHNSVLGVSLAPTAFNFIPPNATAGFQVRLDLPLSSAFPKYYYTLQLSFRPSDPIPVKLRIFNVTEVRTFRGLEEIRGKAHYDGQALASLKVVGTFHGKDGEVILVSSDGRWAIPDTTVPFRLWAYIGKSLNESVKREVANYTIVAEAIATIRLRYSSIPETPWTALLAVQALAVVIVMLKVFMKQLSRAGRREVSSGLAT